MKALRISGISVILARYVGISLGQDAVHDVDKDGTKTGQTVKHVGRKAVYATKAGVKNAGHGATVVAKDSAEGAKKASERTGEGIKDAAAK
jgi:hypothetical protein